MAINTFLGGDGSPSDRLIVNSGAATGTTTVQVTNVGGSGAETTGNGILVVQATNGATTSASAFALSPGELRGGAFDYDLFRGGVSGSPNDWFLRSDFVVEPPGEVLPPETSPPTTTPPNPLPPETSLPTTPPPEPLPPGGLSDHRVGTGNLWGGATSGSAIGAHDPRNARRPGRRHL